jgi:pSer/pThr/pTyr-binding forkhead associated (FHA) protein
VALTGGLKVGSATGSDVYIKEATVCPEHAVVHHEAGKFYITDNDSSDGTWLNGNRLRPKTRVQLHPGDFLEFGSHNTGLVIYKVKQMHVSQKGQGLLASNSDGSARRYNVDFRSAT